jgi:hypothetical protein
MSDVRQDGLRERPRTRRAWSPSWGHRETSMRDSDPPWSGPCVELSRGKGVVEIDRGAAAVGASETVSPAPVGCPVKLHGIDIRGRYRESSCARNTSQQRRVVATLTVST